MQSTTPSEAFDQEIVSSLKQTERKERMIDVARQLIAAPSPNPPLDTKQAAEVAASALKTSVPDIEVNLYSAGEVTNLVARVYGSGPGRRLILNGHLDTYPLGDETKWTVDPYRGKLEGDRLYGRGACDMKGGIAASICALQFLAERRDLWSGELVLTLGGDEESMGNLGARELIRTVPHAKGDAAIIPDAGSPMVTRFGEKGFLWITIEAEGSPAHGAHVHRGINAIDRLRKALDLVSSLRNEHVKCPPLVQNAIDRAKEISEQLSGKGEAEVLSSVTVNVGRIEGGISPNLVPASARFAADIRIPAGIAAVDLEKKLKDMISGLEGVTLKIDRRTEPTFTDPDDEIITSVQSAATEILGKRPALNMRVGASDARVYRGAGVPTVVYGPTPYNMGGADEYVMVSELEAIMQVQALAGLRFLGRKA